MNKIASSVSVLALLAGVSMGTALFPDSASAHQDQENPCPFGQGMMGPGMGGQGMMGPGMGGQGMMGPGMGGQGMMGPGMGGQGMMGPGMGGQGMMGPGMGGQGMMGPGMGGQGMMGPGMGGQGMMGPGMGGQGMMGPGMMMGPNMGGQEGYHGRMVAPQALTVDDVRTMFESHLEWQGNPRLKLGDVEEKDENTIVADIVTVDDSLVQRLEVDRNTGWIKRAQ
ncbi:hypothetical protein [Halomonas binhaiensis]|uniref:PepSY domain-containing protein n=1 Tax=Halomonas binhaiensis TaxID=2562282 RepID=A0A7U3HWN8_9GAMM|nr:hypothetical protein [Halomonas binhaiensis]QRG26792.1 hypothetical protein E4T21_21380 [Halomonas binhaiensis]